MPESEAAEAELASGVLQPAVTSPVAVRSTAKIKTDVTADATAGEGSDVKESPASQTTSDADTTSSAVNAAELSMDSVAPRRRGGEIKKPNVFFRSHFHPQTTILLFPVRH